LRGYILFVCLFVVGLLQAQIDNAQLINLNSDTTLNSNNQLVQRSLLQSPSEPIINNEDVNSQFSIVNSQFDTTLNSQIDSASIIRQLRREQRALARANFSPNPNKALWVSLTFPGAGQVYNRKYWKLPIIYGGFVGCTYALTWNGQMYEDYSQAYLDIMDDNPNTDSFLDLLPPGYPVDANMDYLKRVIKRKKDTYRRYRDMSIFVFIGVYAISIIDAYVDAELASFDLSKDLSMKVEPTVIQNNQYNLKDGNSYGLQCSFRF
jgi:hypothetical protein